MDKNEARKLFQYKLHSSEVNLKHLYEGASVHDASPQPLTASSAASDANSMLLLTLSTFLHTLLSGVFNMVKAC